MATLNDIDRIVLRHGWHESREWARAVDELADLSDGEIERLLKNLPDERAVTPARA